MKLPSSRIQEPYKSATRFVVVGTLGTLIQYGLYYAFLLLFEKYFPEHELTTMAFSLGFILETTINYLLTAWYTFSSRPNIKNLSGFISGRVVNYIIQITLLQIFLMANFNEEIAGFATIIVAGIINYFIVKVFFRKK